MPDIFDTLEAPPKGDIFDEIAPEPQGDIFDAIAEPSFTIGPSLGQPIIGSQEMPVAPPPPPTDMTGERMPDYQISDKPITVADWQEGLMTPIVNIVPHVTPETAGKIMDVAGVVINPLANLLPKEARDRTAAIGMNAAGETINFFTTPLGISTANLGLAPKLVQKGAALAFGTEAALHAPETYANIRDAKTPEEFDAAVTGAILQSAVLLGGLKHGLGESRMTPAERKAFVDSREIILKAPDAKLEVLAKPESDATPEARQIAQDELMRRYNERQAPATTAATDATTPVMPSGSGGAPSVIVVEAELAGARKTASAVASTEPLPDFPELPTKLVEPVKPLPDFAPLPEKPLLPVPESVPKPSPPAQTEPTTPATGETSLPAPTVAKPATVETAPVASGKEEYGTSFPPDYRGGPGAMGPVEAAYQTATRKILGGYNADVEAAQIRRGQVPTVSEARKEDPVTFDAAMDAIEKNPALPEKLVDDILKKEKKSITDEEQQMLTYRRAELENKMAAESERAIDPSLTPDQQAVHQTNAEVFEAQLLRAEEANRMAGTASGRSLRSRQMQMNDDYTYAGLMMRERRATGDVVPKERAAELKKHAEDFKKAQKEADLVAEKERKAIEDAELDAKVDAYEKWREAEKNATQPYHPKVLEQAERIVSKWEEEAAGAAERLKGFFGSESGSVGGVGGPRGEGKKMGGAQKRAQENQRIKDLAIVIRAKIGRFSLNRAKTLESLIVQFGDGVRPYFDKAWQTAQKLIGAEVATKPTKVKEAVKTGATSPDKTPKPPKSTDTLIGEGRAAVGKGEGLHNVVAQIVNGMIDAGNRNRADLFQRAHKIVQEFMPEATERDVRRAYVDYGKRTFPNPEEAAAFKRKTRQAAKIEEDIARIEKEKLRPELQGYQREKLDIELRDLVKRRSELLKDPALPPEPGAFASKDEAKQTRIRNRIEELDRYLRTGEKPVGGKPTAPDSLKTEQLRAEKEALEAYVKEVEAAKNPPLSEAQKALDSAMIARERAGQVLDELSTGKVKDPAKVKEALTQLEEDVRLETDALKALAAEMRRDAKPKTDPGYAKEQAQIKALEKAIANYADKTARGDLSGRGKTQGPDSRRVAQLKDIRESRRAAYKAARDAGKPVLTPEQRYSNARIKALERREKELTERGARQLAGDFAKKPKKVSPALTREALDKKAKVDALKAEVDARLRKYELSQRPFHKKVLSELGEARGIILGGDIGVLLRQGLFSLARPQHFTASTLRGFQAMFSPEASARMDVARRERVIDGRAAEPIRKESGLQTTDTMNHPEEMVVTRLLSRLPDVKIGGRTIKLSAAARGLERFQTTFLNEVRTRTFDAGIRRGFSPQELKLRANFINSATGRSNAKYVPLWLSAIFTSPRYELSRWEMLGQPVRNIGALARDGVKGKLDKAAAANLQDMAVTAAEVYVLFKLAEIAGGYVVNWNPESADFLKMRKGDDVWDVTAGIAPRIRDAVRLYVATADPDSKHNISKTGAGMLLRTINPALKSPIEQLSIAKQRHMDGDDDPKSPFTGFKSNEEREGFIALAPLIIQSMSEALQEDGLGAAAWSGAREFIGTSVSRYPEPAE